MPPASFDSTLRRLALCDPQFVAEIAGQITDNAEASTLEPKTHALVQIAALNTVGATPESYAAVVERARWSGASDEEIVGTLVAAVPVVGAPKVVAAARNLGLALGYDLDQALEDESELA